jgi:hypothetical protein
MLNDARLVMQDCKLIHGPNWKDIRNNCAAERLDFHQMVDVVMFICPDGSFSSDPDDPN